MDTPISVYSTNQTINSMHILNHCFIFYLCYKLKLKCILGVSINIRTNTYYILDTSGSLLALTNNKIKTLLTTKKDIKLLDISIDWLNHQLYILMSSKENNTAYSIKKFDLKREKIEEIVSGFDLKPIQMKVDPYNG